MRFLLSMVDMLFPSHCIICGKSVRYTDHFLCEGCYAGIQVVQDGCAQCSGIVKNGSCIICGDRTFYIDKNVAVAEYNTVLKNIIYHFKFKKNKRLAYHLHKLLLAALTKNEFQPHIIVAVPMNRKKRWERGYNQSELLAKRLAAEIKVPYKSILAEKTSIQSQKSLGYRDRFLNVLDKFRVIDNTVCKGKTILLVDDIFTSGATINECARVLKAAGAAKVFSITVGRAIKIA